MKIPEQGIAKDTLFATMEEYRTRDVPWRAGRTFGYIYDGGREAEAVAKQAYTMFLSENALDFTVFPSLLRFENDVVAMAIDHLHGPAEAVGNFTSGGTESIMLAVKAARDYFRSRFPERGQPEMILPVTAHAAFHKAASYLGVTVVPVPVDPTTFKADVAAARAAVTPNTALLVGSATSYAHGVTDPIRELGEIALEHDLLFHVDGCIGGFLLPYLARLGEPVTDFDFRVPGVTSISMDFHKYAYAAKGASVVLYKNKEIRKHQFFACARWTGYSVINATIQSSKSGGPMAAAWAVLRFIGDDGYLEIARRLRDATHRLVAGIEAIDGLRVMAKPEMSLIAVASDTLSVFHLADLMGQKGWYIQPQLGFAGHQENFHLSIGPSNVEWVEPLLADLADCVEVAKTIPPSPVGPQIKAAFAHLDPKSLTPEMFTQMLAMAGINGVGLPEKMAEINEMLNALPRELCERLLTEYVNQLFVPGLD